MSPSPWQKFEPVSAATDPRHDMRGCGQAALRYRPSGWLESDVTAVLLSTLTSLASHFPANIDI